MEAESSAHPPASVNPDLIKLPSRLIASDEVPSYTLTVRSRLDILSGRTTDPFGQVQDPSAPPKVVKPTVTNRRPTTLKRTSFDDIVGRIKVNTIMPAENRFLIGTRSFKLGDQIPIMYRGRKTMIEVIRVKSTKIDFKNTDTGEISSVELKLMPAGMSAGGDKFTAPGMVEDKADTPLQLDSPSGF